MEHTSNSLLFHNMQKIPFYVQCFIKYSKNDFMGELGCQVNPMKKTINTYRKMAPLESLICLVIFLFPSP
jgi:hypothetical protein